MSQLPNFKSSVPVEVQSKMKELSELATFDDIVTGFASHGAMMEERTDEIEGNYKSGWLPSQDGGFTLSQYYQCDVDSSYHFTEKQADFVNDQSEQCFKAFLSDNGIEDSGMNDAYEGLTEEQKESLSEYEMEWFQDGALLSLEMFVDGYGEYSREPEKTVTIRLAINYKDAPYFRERYAEDIKQLIYSLDEFMSLKNVEILKEFQI